jgi:hypothetical protein
MKFSTFPKPNGVGIRLPWPILKRESKIFSVRKNIGVRIRLQGGSKDIAPSPSNPSKRAVPKRRL